MPDENENMPPQPSGPPAKFNQDKCPKCGQMMAFRAPHTSIFNSISVSIISITHEGLDKCPSCGTIFVLQIAAVAPDSKIVFTVNEVGLRNTGLIEGTQSNLSQAIDLEKVTKGMRKQ